MNTTYEPKASTVHTQLTSAAFSAYTSASTWTDTGFQFIHFPWTDTIFSQDLLPELFPLSLSPTLQMNLQLFSALQLQLALTLVLYSVLTFKLNLNLLLAILIATFHSYFQYISYFSDFAFSSSQWDHTNLINHFHWPSFRLSRQLRET